MSHISQIVYFEGEGRDNQERTIDAVVDRWRDDRSLPIICFTWGGESALRVREVINDTCRLIAVTPSPNQPVHSEEEGRIYPPTARPETQEKLREAGIPTVTGIQAFDDMIIPGADSVKHETIRETLRMISGALSLCVNAVLMACSAGQVVPGEEVISFASDTAIVAVAAIHPFVFHPGEGFELREILCKPRVLTHTRPRDQWREANSSTNTNC